MRHLTIASLALAVSTTFLATTSALGQVPASPVKQQVPEPASDRFVDLCICLDTSGSMDGLIHSAQQKLWSIVNELALAKPTPRLRVALLTYGNDGHREENGWVKIETPFTEDLDQVSQMLFGLTTNGGTELVGRVIQTSIEELHWHPSDDALKMLFVAGNESADQDERFPFLDMCKAAIATGIMVNPVYCVYPQDAVDVKPGWEQIARHADGQFAMIDQDNGVVVLATPFDKRLGDLSAELNTTYIPIGEQGRAGQVAQTLEDNNNLELNAAANATRAVTKANALYFCSWDAVDASMRDDFDITTVDVKDLPENMQAMTVEERVAYVAAMREKRQTIQASINELNAKRQVLQAAEQLRRADSGVTGFDLAVRTALRRQAGAKGYKFPRVEPSEQQPSTFDEKKQLAYFVMVGSAWVANTLTVAYEQSVQDGVEFETDQTIAPGTPEYDALYESLHPDAQQALQAANGVVILEHEDVVYQIAGGC